MNKRQVIKNFKNYFKKSRGLKSIKGIMENVFYKKGKLFYKKTLNKELLSKLFSFNKTNILVNGFKK